MVVKDKDLIIPLPFLLMFDLDLEFVLVPCQPGLLALTISDKNGKAQKVCVILFLIIILTSMAKKFSGSVRIRWNRLLKR